MCISGNPLLCNQPSLADQLQVALVPAQIAAINAPPSAPAIAIGHVAVVTVTKAVDSPVPAQNLTVDVPPASSIMVDASRCAAPLPPAASFDLHVGGTTAETATALVLSADDATATSVSVTLIDDVLFEDGFDAGPSIR